MNDFLVFVSAYDQCLEDLGKVLQRCENFNLVFNWGKCHFMVLEWIVLEHKDLRKGLKVDQSKIVFIEKLPPPTTLKGVRSSLSHTGFYGRFTKDFPKL